MWRVVFSKQAAKDAKKLSASGLKAKAQSLIEVLKEDPFATPPRYERLVGDLAGGCTRAELIFSTGLSMRCSRKSTPSASYVCGPTTSEPLCGVRTSTGGGGVGHMPKSIGHNADGGHILASYL